MDSIDLIIERYDSLELDLEKTLLKQVYSLDNGDENFSFHLQSLFDTKKKQSYILNINKSKDVRAEILKY